MQTPPTRYSAIGLDMPYRVGVWPLAGNLGTISRRVAAAFKYHATVDSTVVNQLVKLPKAQLWIGLRVGI